MRKLLPSIFSLVFASMLTGCGVDPLTTTVTGGATVISYSVLGKSPMDYGLSEARKQDCDIRNPKKYDGRYCVDYAETVELEREQTPVYCYRSLGDVYCTRAARSPSGSPPLGQTTLAETSGQAVRLPPTAAHEPESLVPATRGAEPAKSRASGKGSQPAGLSHTESAQPVRPRPASDPSLRGS